MMNTKRPTKIIPTRTMCAIQTLIATTMAATITTKMKTSGATMAKIPGKNTTSRRTWITDTKMKYRTITITTRIIPKMNSTMTNRMKKIVGDMLVFAGSGSAVLSCFVVFWSQSLPLLSFWSLGQKTENQNPPPFLRCHPGSRIRTMITFTTTTSCCPLEQSPHRWRPSIESARSRKESSTPENSETSWTNARAWAKSSTCQPT
mmetsp:Transcript_9742/g.29031  ORF Transcript_9742/g.29031 Transcript_9742/m.29031 type:complete len:204 (+) Transcript_9742:349-960(+)